MRSKVIGNKLPAIPAASAKWTRLLLAVGVSVPLALAPLLGKLPIPLFPSLLSLIPVSIQGVVLPVSAAAMALVSAWVELREVQSNRRKSLLLQVKRSFALAVMTLSLFVIAHQLLTTRVEYDGGKSAVTFVRGWHGTEAEPCRGLSSATCIARLGLKQDRIQTYFGELAINVSSLILEFLYVGFFTAFGNFIALIVKLRR